MPPEVFSDEQRLEQVVQENPEILLGLGLFSIAAIISMLLLVFYLAKQRGERASFLPTKGVPALEFPFSWSLLLLILYGFMVFSPPIAFLLVPLGVLLTRKTTSSLEAQWGSQHFSLAELVWITPWLYLAAMAFIFPLSALISTVFQQIGFDLEMQEAVNRFLQAKSGKELASLFLLAVVVAPLMEEFIFRGFLHPLLKAWMPTWLAIMMTSLFFAAMHENLAVFGQLFVLALFLSWTYEYTRSLPLCMALHFVFNATTAGFLLTLRFFYEKAL